MGGYLQIFLSKRVLPIYMLMALLSVVYYGMGHLLALEPPSLSCFIQSFFFGNTVIKFGWFLQAIIFLQGFQRRSHIPIQKQRYVFL